MKILHIAHFTKGGVATILNEILSSQIECDECEVSVLVAEGHDKYLNVTSKIMTSPSGRSFLDLFGFAAAIIRAYLVEKPDIVHLHSTFAGLIGRLVLPWWGCAIVYQPHGVAFDPQRVVGWKQKSIRAIEYFLSFRTSAFVAISKYEEALVQQIARRTKIWQIDNGVADVEINVNRSRNGRVLFVGRHDRQKGLDLLIDLHKDSNVRVQLDVAGGAVVDNLDLDHINGINYLGWIDNRDLPNLYSKYSAVVMPSRWEGFGLVAIESLRSGTPVICSDRGALPTIIQNEITGIVCCLEKFGRYYPDACKRLSTNQDVHLYNRCRQHYRKNFQSTLMCSRVLELYRTLQS